MKKLSTIMLLLLSAHIQAATEIKIAAHSSFDIPKEHIAAFEQQNDAKITILKLGDGNELLNKLIISKKNPIADAVYGLDNSNILRAQKEGILSATQPQSANTVVSVSPLLAVDYAFVTLNYDKKWFAEKNLPVPQSLDDLTKPEYKNLLVSPNPNTSTPAMAFLLANIGGLGEEKAFKWWADMRKNGVKITKGWSEAYYTEFTLNGGTRPIMVGYASSPAAEVFYSEGKLSTPNMGNLFLNGGNYLQIEGAAVLEGSKNTELAGKFVQFLQSPNVQNSVSTSMWVYPAVKDIYVPRAMLHATVPPKHYAPNAQRINQHQKEWLNRWTKTVLK